MGSNELPEGTALYFEDFAQGQSYTSHSAPMTSEDIIAYAHAFDPQPFHTDPERAEDLFFGQHVASGWHTVSLAIRLMVETLPIAGGVVGAGAESVRWPKPVRPGDVLHATVEVEHTRASTSRPEIGIVGIRLTALNQSGEPVLVMHPRLVVPVRASAG